MDIYFPALQSMEEVDSNLFWQVLKAFIAKDTFYTYHHTSLFFSMLHADWTPFIPFCLPSLLPKHTSNCESNM